MPTIELISLGCVELPKIPKYEHFEYILEDRLLSHRGMFQKYLDKEQGVIVHLGSKELEGEEDFWFAGGLIEWGEGTIDLPVVDFKDLRNLENWGQDQDFLFQFRHEVKVEIKD